MEAQERIGTWCAWGVAVLSWIGFLLVLAHMFRAAGCNFSSEAGTQSMDIVAESVGFEARAKSGASQRVQQGSLSSQPVSWFGSQRRDRSVATGPGFPHRVHGPMRGHSVVNRKHVKGERTMKSQNPSTNAQNMRTEVRSDEPEGTGENGPSLAEIRLRAFEIHIERGGIHGCDPDDWLQAERELQESTTRALASNRKDDAEGGTKCEYNKTENSFHRRWS